MTFTTFGSTNSAQFINNTVINKTEITKGYPFDDVTLKGINFFKANGYGFIKPFTEQLYYETWTGNFEIKDTIKSKNISLVPTNSILFVVSYESGGTFYPLNASSYKILIDNFNLSFEQQSEVYITVDKYLKKGQTVHVKVYQENAFFAYPSYEGDITITDEIFNALIPTVFIALTLNSGVIE